MKTKSFTLSLALSCFYFLSFQGSAQMVGVNKMTPMAPMDITQPEGVTLGNGQPVLQVEYTGAMAGDALGILARSVPADGRGIGGYFEGGLIGLEGVVLPAGSDGYFGTAGIVDGGNGTNYGIYGAAYGAGVNYAGYFGGGNVFIDNKLGIGVNNPVHLLDISGSQGVARLTSNSAINGSVLELRNLTATPDYIGAINFSLSGGATPGQIAYNINNNLTFRVNNAERLRINQNGFLGIGSISPLHPVHIKQPPGLVLMEGQPLMHVEYTGTETFDAIGIRGKSKPADYFGVGGEFEGGWIGVRGKVNGAGGPGHQYYGVRGEATGSGATKYGVYGVASGSGTNWAGYFEGKVYAGSSMGIAREPVTNALEVEGNASKSSSGDWLANSDARLKKNILALDSREMLHKLLSLQGITYEWNDDKTGSSRPDGILYGFTAQNIRDVFPSLVEEDALGYLQTAYGTYDAMMVEAIRALHEENASLKEEIRQIKELLHANAGTK